MTVHVRDATKDDVTVLLQVIDLASDGLIPQIWEQLASEGLESADIGTALVTADEGDFSYRNAIMVTREDRVLGGLIGYPLRTVERPDTVPAAFVPIVELVSQVPGYWYVNVMAVLPEGRRQGLGKVLLTAAESQARADNCPELALVVAANNTPAANLYAKAGFVEKARCPFDLSDFDLDPTEAILMVRELN